jgi:hypothetical protein
LYPPDEYVIKTWRGCSFILDFVRYLSKQAGKDSWSIKTNGKLHVVKIKNTGKSHPRPSVCLHGVDVSTVNIVFVLNGI